MADKAEFLQAIDDAILDADSLERFINGDDTQDVLTRLSKQYPTLQKALKELFENGGIAGRFKTLTELQASPLTDGDYALVADDAGNINGLYVNDGGDWVKSKYDPYNYIDDLVARSTSSDIFNFVDAAGKSVYKVTSDGKHYFIGLNSDLKTEIEKHTEQSNSDNIFEVVDKDGRLSLAQDSNGDLLLPKIGNLTQYLDGIKTDVLSNESSSSAIGAYKAGEYADNILLRFAEDKEVINHLLTKEQLIALNLVSHSVSMPRIPAITRIDNDKFVLFFEVRSDISDTGFTSCASAIITVNEMTGEVSLSNAIALHEAYYEGDLYHSYMNPCGVYINDDKLVCMYVERTVDTTTSKMVAHRLLSRTSTDGGLSWGSVVDITDIYNDGTNNLEAVIPCSKGLVKRFGVHKGRVVFPAWRSGRGYTSSQFRAGFIYSDDDGDTWHMGDFDEQFPTGNEVQCAEDLNGDLIFAIRLDRSYEHRRVLARYNHEKRNFTQIAHGYTFTHEAIMGSIAQMDNIFDRANGKLMQAVSRGNEGTRDRQGLLIHTSYSGGDEWQTYEVPELVSEYVGYACIDSLTPDLVFLVWESDGVRAFKCGVISIKNILGDA